MGINAEFWKDKSVFITGHTGFKGGWLSLWLQELGASVSGYALEPSTDPSFFHVARVGESMRSTIGDVLDSARLLAAMEDSQPDIVFHLAAQPLVQPSYNDPAGTFAVNVMGTVNFLEAVRKIPSIKVAIVITSDKCYAQYENPSPFREDDPMGGQDPYSSSKGCAELVVHAYRHSFFSDQRCGLASARAGNVIGGGDWSDHRLIPDLVRAFSEHKVLRLRYPHAVRPWQHVLEPLCGYLQLAERIWHTKGAYARGWNFGPVDKPRTVLDIVQRAITFWEGDAQWMQAEEPINGESNCLSINSSLARKMLEWQTWLDFETMLTWTLLWYKKFSEKSNDMQKFSLRQINRYSKKYATASNATDSDH